MKVNITIEHIAQNGEKSIIENSDRFLIGLDGRIFENYGKGWRECMWEEVFDGEVKIVGVSIK